MDEYEPKHRADEARRCNACLVDELRHPQHLTFFNAEGVVDRPLHRAEGTFR